jgi:hypothetical protein
MQVLSGEDGAIGGKHFATIGTVIELFDRCRDTLRTSLFGFAHCLTPNSTCHGACDVHPLRLLDAKRNLSRVTTFLCMIATRALRPMIRSKQEHQVTD